MTPVPIYRGTGGANDSSLMANVAKALYYLKLRESEWMRVKQPCVATWVKKLTKAGYTDDTAMPFARKIP